MKKKILLTLLALAAFTGAKAQVNANGYEYVDLGLPSGTLWATCNVGATTPEGYGDYFAWGETSSLRIPTSNEVKELQDNTTSEWTTQNGVNGRKFTGKTNGNSIFLPASGYKSGTYLNLEDEYGYYWSSSLYSVNPNQALCLYFRSNHVGRDALNRSYGLSVRLVMSKSGTGIAAPTVAASSADSIRYNLSGQRVSASYKGIVIENGHKRLVR